MANQKVKFKITSPQNLISFVKRFSGIEKSLLLEITQNSIEAKAYTPDKSVLKFSRLPFVDVLEGTTPGDILVPMYNVDKIINVFKHFADGDEIFLDVLVSKEDSQYTALELMFYTSNLKIKMQCADMSLFKYVGNDTLKKAIKVTMDMVTNEFPFPKDAFAKINQLCSIDAAIDFLQIIINNDGEIIFKGKSFEYTLGHTTANKPVDLRIYNKQFGYIDQEISQFHISSERLLVKSQESNSLITLGRMD